MTVNAVPRRGLPTRADGSTAADQGSIRSRQLVPALTGVPVQQNSRRRMTARALIEFWK